MLYESYNGPNSTDFGSHGNKYLIMKKIQLCGSDYNANDRLMNESL